MKTDAEIQKDVMEELRWEPLLNAAEIGVAVKNGIVTLTGMVEMIRPASFSFASLYTVEPAAKILHPETYLFSM